MPPYSDDPGDTATAARRLRDDLAAVEVDGDIVVYDPAAPACHVLSGGAVLVWMCLDGFSTDGVIDRVLQHTGDDDAGLPEQIMAVVDEFEGLDLLVPVE